MQIVYKPARRIYGKTKDKIQTQSKVPPIDFHAKTGLAVEYLMSGNMTQASTQEYSITDIPPIDFRSDGNGLSAYSIYGNMVQKSPNLVPSPTAATKSNGGLTVTCDGKGVYTLSAENAVGSVDFPVEEFTIPNSSIQGGNGTLSLLNDFTGDARFRFYYNTTYLGDMTASELNRTSTAYYALAGVTVNKINIYATGSFSGTAKPMITDDGQLPENFIPHTPTPDAPITPEECGDKTANLFTTSGSTANVFITDSGELGTNSSYSVSDYIAITALRNYTISPISTQNTTACHAYYRADKTLISTITGSMSPQLLYTPENATYIRVSWRSASVSEVMLNKGSTALPYAPYGYCITLSL